MNLLQREKKKNYENRIRFATFASARRGLSPTCFLALHLLEWLQQREAQIYISQCANVGEIGALYRLACKQAHDRERELAESSQAHCTELSEWQTSGVW